jgi:hypothetical protein
MLKTKNHGVFGWVIVFCVVVAFDYWAIKNRKQTMSQAFKKALYMKSSFVFVAMFWTLLTWHLIHPHRYRNTDILSVVFDKKKENKWQI